MNTKKEKIGSVIEDLGSSKDGLEKIYWELKTIVDEIGSLELQKKNIAEKIHSKDYDKDDFSIIVRINKAIMDFISKEKNWLNIQRKIEKQEIELLDLQSVDNEEANKIIESLYTHLSPEYPTLKYYLKSGLLGLQEISEELRKKRDDVKDTSAAVIVNELRELEENLKKQNELARGILIKTTIHQVIPLISKPKTEKINTLISYIKTELEKHNQLLREVGFRNIEIRREKEEIADIVWLEQEELELLDDAWLVANQFDIPKIHFGTRYFASLTFSRKDALQIIAESKIGAVNIPPVNYKPLRIAYEVEEFPYIKYDLDSVVPKNNSYGIVFPLEKVMTGKYFKIDKSNPRNIEVVGAYLDNVKDKLVSKNKQFEETLEKIEEKYIEWVNEAKRLNREFKVEWTRNAKEIIAENFGTRWIKNYDMAIEFDLVHRIMRVKYTREEIQEMSKKQLINAVKECKKFYNNLIVEAEEFLSSATIEQDIDPGIFFVPQSEVLFWEKYFVQVGYRPKVYYYSESDIRKAVMTHLDELKTDFVKRGLPDTKTTDIIDAENGQALRTL